MAALRVLIIGGGLAGSNLALALMGHGATVCVADAGVDSASRRAAGIFNPVTGKTFDPTWRAAELFTLCHAWYGRWQKEWGGHFLHTTGIVRPFADAGARQRWLTRPDQSMGQLLPEGTTIEERSLPEGGLYLPAGGWLDVPAFLDAAQAHLAQHATWHQATVHPDQLLHTPAGIQWHDQLYDVVVWANGLGSKAVWDLPLVPLKGELLCLHTTQAPPQHIWIKSGFVVPHPDGTVWVGSTYQHQFVDANPTPQGRQTLLSNFAKSGWGEPADVCHHWAGIRPTSRDRRPIVGQVAPRQYVCNGLGTKGVTLAPWVAHRLAEHLVSAAPIPPEIAADREFPPVAKGSGGFGL